MNLQEYAKYKSLDKEIVFNKETKEIIFIKTYNTDETLVANCIGISPVDNDMIYDTRKIFIGMISKDSLWRFMKFAHYEFLRSNESYMINEVFAQLQLAYKDIQTHIEDVLKSKYDRYDELMFHQKEALIDGFYKDKLVYALEQGLGKTLIGISKSIGMSFKRTLIVCPSVAKYNWVEELYEWGVPMTEITVVDGDKTIISSYEKFVVINYDILDKWHVHLKRRNFDHIILDECHKIKNTESIRNNVINSIQLASNSVISFLSGTPAPNTIDDIFAYLQLGGNELGKSRSEFIKRFTKDVITKSGLKKTVGTNLELLNLCLSNFFFRRRKDILSLPDKKYHKLHFDIGDYKQEYDNAYDEMLKRISEKGSKSFDLSISQLGIITSKSKVKNVISLAESISDKLQEVYVDSTFISDGVKRVVKNKKIEVKSKVIIFCPYIEPLNMLEAHFRNRCVRIDGKVSAKKRIQLSKLFKTSRSVNFLIAQTDAAGIAINLVNKEKDKNLPAINTCIHLGFPFTNAQLEQANDRIHRIGQWKDCDIYYTLAKKTIDEKILNLVERKYSDVSSAIDGYKDLIDFNNLDFSSLELASEALFNSIRNEEENEKTLININ